MELQEFAEKLLETMTKQMENDKEVTLSTMLTTNDVKGVGLLIRKTGQHTGIRFRVEELYKNYLDSCCEADLNEMADQLIADYKEKMENLESMADQVSMNIFDFSQVKYMIYLKLINTGWSEQLLKTTPHVPYLDLSAVFYLSSPAGDILIHEFLMDMWNITAHELYEIALNNMVKQQPAKLFSVLEFLLDNGVILPEKMNEKFDASLYALTNMREQYGASVLLYPNILEMYANQYECDWLVIPSSVHEVLLRPCYSEAEIENVCAAITEINESLLEADDILSDHPYLYRRDRKELIPIKGSGDAYSQICRSCAI